MKLLPRRLGITLVHCLANIFLLEGEGQRFGLKDTLYGQGKAFVEIALHSH